MEQHCLRWNDHQTNFISAFSNLLTCETLVDVTLAAEGSYIQAHKIVLSACSSYFQTLFTVNPCQHPIVILKDVQFGDLKIIINFIYNGEVNVSQEELPQIMKTAELLKIKGLAEIALDRLVPKPDHRVDRPEFLTAAHLNCISEAEPKQTTSLPCPSLSWRTRNRRKSSEAMAESSETLEPPPLEPLQQVTGDEDEIFTSNVDVDDTIMKFETTDNFPSVKNCDFDTFQEESHGSYKEEFLEEITDFETDQTTEQIPDPEYELDPCIESTSMECPGPSQEQDPIAIESPIGTDLNLLPEKSRKKYEVVYRRFKEWCERKKAPQVTENVLLAYFFEKSKHLKSATLWCDYSMLKAVLAVKDNIDIRKYSKLSVFLKRKAIGYRPIKSKVFTREQFYKFLTEAPDEKYLMMKVVAIIGIAGTCNRDEMQSMTIDDVEDIGSVLIIKISKSNTNKPRSFVISGKEDDLNMVNIYRKYASLRPRHTKHNRLFLQYRHGKCSVQVVGVNTIGKIPSEIARYLSLPNPSQYTGHCYRRTSAALLVDSGAGIFSLKRIHDWQAKVT